MQEEHRRLLELKQKEEERLRAEAQLAAEAAQLQALKLKSIPKPVPPPSPVVAPEEPKQPPVSKAQAQSVPPPASPIAAKSPPAVPQVAKESVPPATQQQPPLPRPVQQPSPAPSQPLPSQGPFGTPKAAQPAPQGAAAVPKIEQPKPAPAPPPAPAPAPAEVDRYVQLHRNLKKLRASVLEEAKSNAALKAKMGDMRREIRKSIGQLTGGKGANAQPVQKIVTTLKDALEGAVPSRPVEVAPFVLDQAREPVEGAAHNDAMLPSLFLYLINIFSKAVINQFINECGANPKAADPIGVVTAQIFSRKEFYWRGKTLIDVLIAKFRIVCPVVFGFRGSDRTEQGRARVGWRREGGGWMPEQLHHDRMTGLGAGFAAISLRDFSRTHSVNPYPPRNYWTAMAKIVNTPAAEISATQCVVLKAMIENYEQRFIGFYGNAAVALLRVALVDFPARSPEKSPAVGALQVLAQVLKRDWGLDLEGDS